MGEKTLAEELANTETDGDNTATHKGSRYSQSFLEVVSVCRALRTPGLVETITSNITADVYGTPKAFP